MATSPTEVFHTNYQRADWAAYNYNDDLMFAIATALSSSNHFEIIDSYSSGNGRYKGDPIADGEWLDADDAGDENSWFVIECQTEDPAVAALGYSGLPKWQLKFQWVTRSVYLADVSDTSGTKYPKNHGEQYDLYARFAPWGGWDLEDSEPDFNPTTTPSPTVTPAGTYSSNNHEMSFGANTWIVVLCANGTLTILCRYSSGQYRQVSMTAGDVLPPSTEHMPTPRFFYGGGMGPTTSPTHNYYLGYAGFLQESGSWSNESWDYETNDRHNGGIVFWNQNNERIETAYRTTRCRALAKRQGNHQASAMEVDSFPYLVIPKKDSYGIRFALPQIRKGWGHGSMTMENKTLMTGDEGWTTIFPWDGSSSTLR